MSEVFKEIGVGATAGRFGGYNSLMVTQNFAPSGSATFVTGVAYNDANGDNFYSIGEGQGGITTELRLNSMLLDSTGSWLSGRIFTGDHLTWRDAHHFLRRRTGRHDRCHLRAGNDEREI